jgi:hypothetical protein
MMNARTTKPLTVEKAAELWIGFGQPPVLSSENREHYDILRNACVASCRPTNMWTLSLIRELVDTQWEILRVLRYRTALIERTHQGWLPPHRKVGYGVERRKEELRQLAANTHDPETREQLLNLQPIDPDPDRPNDTKHGVAFEHRLNLVKELDKLLKTANQRRNNLMEILRYYCRPVDQETEIFATTYNEVTEKKVKQIAAPLVPPELLTNDITTEKQVEAVNLAQ